MSDGEGFISRWSRRKSEAKAQPQASRAEESAAKPVMSSSQAAPMPAEPPAALPPVETLTPESDFAPFMKPEVDPGVKREAMKKLFQDPRFNVMDGLDVYIDDYSKPDPMPEEWLAKLEQVKRLGHFQEPDEKEPPAPETRNAALQSSMEKPAAEQPLVAPEASSAADTFATQNSAAQVGESRPERE